MGKQEKGRLQKSWRRRNGIKKQLMYPQKTTGRNTSNPWLASLMTGKIAVMSPVPESRTEVQVVSLICIKFNLTEKYPRRNGRGG